MTQEQNITACSQSESESLINISKELRSSLSVISLQIEAIEDGMYFNNNNAFEKLREKLIQFEQQIHTITNK